ncbi:hypothetical protein Lfu02_73320 [Longispora fulva]|uniref:Uncharacterized protein n=1 Tax=Longispora fulva TaxID=619741 RepID=A0A8J7GLT3_9ACTN|nr:hypothetical protein [Longispora fulva]MBG6133918.1 hypothetical protein [Longispora fulva]GIG62960.1 hypothetical protein Lfu02_73320 [Longispora fulva]
MMYRITTHSAHLLDHEHEHAVVYHVRADAAGTRIDPATRPGEHAAVCADRGYRPSDLNVRSLTSTLGPTTSSPHSFKALA